MVINKFVADPRQCHFFRRSFAFHVEVLSVDNQTSNTLIYQYTYHAFILRALSSSRSRNWTSSCRPKSLIQRI